MSSKVSRRKVLKTAGKLAASVPVWGVLGAKKSQAKTKVKHKKPNILFIMTDDHTQKALSIYGNPILKTPSMDWIGRNGALFQNAFTTNSLCTPSRISFLTGLYSTSTGVPVNEVFVTDPKTKQRRPIIPKYVTQCFDSFPKVLQREGYYTGLVGKWHIEDIDKQGNRVPPEGFDYYSIIKHQGSYYNPVMYENSMQEQTITGRSKLLGDHHYQGISDVSRTMTHTDFVIGDRALEYLTHYREQDKNKNGDRPFCLLYQFKAPHGPWQPAAQYVNAFEGKQFDDAVEKMLSDGGWDELLRDEPDIPAVQEAHNHVEDMNHFKYQKMHGIGMKWTPEENKAWVLPEIADPEQKKKAKFKMLLKRYYSVLLGVDFNIGRVLRELQRQDLLNNTIIVYTSDNGHFMGEHGMYDKRLMYEPSIKIPMLVYYPPLIRPGTVDDEFMLLNVDMMPSLLEMAGIQSPKGIHGESFLPVLSYLKQKGKAMSGLNKPDWRTSFLYHFFEGPDAVHRVPKHRGIRARRYSKKSKEVEEYKLIHYFEQNQEKMAWEFFDLNSPRGRRELHNMYSETVATPQGAALIASLKQELVSLSHKIGDRDFKLEDLLKTPSKENPHQCKTSGV